MSARYQGVWGLSTDFLGYFIPEDEWNKPKHDADPKNSDYEEVIIDNNIFLYLYL